MEDAGGHRRRVATGPQCTPRAAAISSSREWFADTLIWTLSNEKSPPLCKGGIRCYFTTTLSVLHHATVGQWILRYGCYRLKTNLEHAEDWISISIGKLKCLATIYGENQHRFINVHTK